MQRKLGLVRQRMRLEWHRNRMKAIATDTGYSHSILMDTHRAYRSHSHYYNEAKNALEEAGEYVTAISLIRNKAPAV